MQISLFSAAECRPVLQCTWRPWSVWHHHKGKDFSRISTKNGNIPLYSDFAVFSKDQEHLISTKYSFDYIEGFVLINRTGILNNWRSSFDPNDPVQASQFVSDRATLYCLEMAMYFNSEETETMNKVSIAIDIIRYQAHDKQPKKQLKKSVKQ